MEYLAGDFDTSEQRYGIVAARFNKPITMLLVEGAMDSLLRHGVNEEAIALAWVPGAFEIPIMAKKMAESGKYDAIICLGAVIRGETAHFDYVASGTTSGIMQAGLDTGVPVIFGLLTTDTKEQAEIRAGTKGVNMGFSSAMTAIEMVNLLKLVP